MKQWYEIEARSQFQEGCCELVEPTLWQSGTCKLGWDVMGIYPPGGDGSNINCVDTNRDKSLLAVGDDFGTMCVFRYPCASSKHDCVRLGGHSSHVTRARFF